MWKLLNRLEDGTLSEEDLGLLRDRIRLIEVEFPGVKIVAVDEEPEEILFGGEYLKKLEASI
jgi:hypothetical protein